MSSYYFSDNRRDCEVHVPAQPLLNALEYLEKCTDVFEFDPFVSRIETIYRRINTEARIIRDKENELRRKREEASKKEFLPKLHKWLQDGNLKVGTLVRFRGCRDRHGKRKVTAMSFHKNGFNNYEWDSSITGEQLRNGYSGTRYITTHKYEKLSHVEVNGKWIPIKEIVG
jgi:hypothetical protein